MIFPFGELELFVTLRTIFPVCIFLLVCRHWHFWFVVSVVRQWLNQDFLKYLSPQMRKMGPISLSFPVAAAGGSQCWQEGQKQGRCLSAPGQTNQNTQPPVFGEQDSHDLSRYQLSFLVTWASVSTSAGGAEEWGNGSWFAHSLYSAARAFIKHFPGWCKFQSSKIVDSKLSSRLIGCFGGVIQVLAYGCCPTLPQFWVTVSDFKVSD